MPSIYTMGIFGKLKKYKSFTLGANEGLRDSGVENATNRVPKYHELMNPLLEALRALGGSGSINEISEKVAEIIELPDEVLSVLHSPERSGDTEVDYRLAWARTYLKKYGILDNSTRGVWAIRPDKSDITHVDPQEVVRKVRELDQSEKELKHVDEDNRDILPDEAEAWRSKLHKILTKELDPDAFERLVKRMLREAGFVQVEVTGKSGDGGLDGNGILRLGGLLSFHVYFQCKRYQGSVTASAIRDFRGALMGRADKGLFVTTGTFTSGAKQEATRDGATPIDLMNGDELADKLKELGLGIGVEMVESVTIDEQWFHNI